jgi:hypothetical protein
VIQILQAKSRSLDFRTEFVNNLRLTGDLKNESAIMSSGILRARLGLPDRVEARLSLQEAFE